jgi:signal transduction histidine kinase
MITPEPRRGGRTGAAVFARDGELLLQTPGFGQILGIGDNVVAHGLRLERMIAQLGAIHPHVERLSEDRLRCRTADDRTVELSFEQLGSERCCVSVTDISEQLEIEDELRRAQGAAEAASQAKSRFLATMSHELRTPLNAVIGFSDALTREATARGDAPVDRERVAEFAGAIQQAGQHLLGLINNILDVARIESGRFDLASDPIDLPHMVQGCVRQAAQAAQAAEVSIEVSIRPGLPRLRGDERRLRQVIAHLLANAIKFTQGGGQVVIGAEMASDHDLLINVSDSGIGIPAEDIERVFEPFHQLDTGLARRVPGAGLGLYFCRALVQAHGGSLKLSSRPAEGTTATVRLPHTRLITAPYPLELLQEAP